MTAKTGTSSGGAALAFMAPTLVAAAVPLVTLPIYTRYLTPAEYGVWGLVVAFGSVFSSALGMGLQAGYERTYFSIADGDARRSLLFSVGAFSAGLQLVGLMLSVASWAVLAPHVLPLPDSPLIIALGFWVAAISNLKQLFLVTLRNEGRAGDFLRYSVDDLLLGALLSLGAVVWVGLGVAGLLLGPALSSTAVLLALTWHSLGGRRVRPDWRHLHEVLAISLPLAPRVLIGAVGNQLDRLVLGAVGSLSGVGLYTVAQRVAQVVFQFMTALQQVYQPTVYRMLFASARPADIGRYLLPWAYASAAGGLAAILFASEGLRLVTGSEFWAGDVMVGVLAVHYSLMFFGKQPQLVFGRRTGWVSVLSLASVFVNATFVYLGATWAGGIGTAVGTLCSGVLLGAVSLYLSQRVAPIGYPVRTTVAAFASLPLALAAMVIARRVSLNSEALLFIKVLFVVLFVMLGWRSGVLATLRKAGNVAHRQPSSS